MLKERQMWIECTLLKNSEIQTLLEKVWLQPTGGRKVFCAAIPDLVHSNWKNRK